ncbi:PASTA domain-containing protein [candidate division KSB1 bacterium]|nr:PASTA domain-containing protein [candidate division KSB1 bacterium]NIR70397.1 PASTA domain-containing protein [candidate division KSB1 bacterium]NIS25937.1 PASTA domain-containing protein [candidate division KSB1 bacterium]NIT69960.1 PASTA domain-containing protein [candidate division KSB1 bacterium]NIU26625.1 PASTA domain-containing protein [candidate division KSB1 bacterium]
MIQDLLTNIKDFLAKVFTPKTVAILAALFVAFVAVVILFDQVIMPRYTRHGEALAVPNVVAERYETAKELLEMQGLEAVKQGEQYDSQIPFGYVVDQNPRANRLVKKGRRVYLTVSVGEKEVQVPNLVGLSETNAEETLKSLGLRVGEREYKYVPNEVPKVVIEQSVPSESFVKANSAVDITVSLGEPVENVMVPSILGKTLESAKREIQRAGLTFGDVSYQFNQSLLPNTVIDQSPEPGLKVSAGDTVNLIVSRIGESN